VLHIDTCFVYSHLRYNDNKIIPIFQLVKSSIFGTKGRSGKYNFSSIFSNNWFYFLFLSHLFMLFMVDFFSFSYYIYGGLEINCIDSHFLAAVSSGMFLKGDFK
jgi:hypothetical protein